MSQIWEIEDRIHLLAAVNTGCEELQRGEGTIITCESEFLHGAMDFNRHLANEDLPD